MIVSLIAALTKNGVIGKDNDLPWHLPDDMKYFMKTTTGHSVIMGRKNWESLPQKFKPLKDRFNIVISSQSDYRAPGATLVSSWDEAFHLATVNTDRDQVFVIGGAKIYQLALPHAGRLYLTEINATLEGDTFFPTFNKSEWSEKSRDHHPSDARHPYAFDFVIYERRVKSLT